MQPKVPEKGWPRGSFGPEGKNHFTDRRIALTHTTFIVKQLTIFSAKKDNEQKNVFDINYNTIASLLDET